MRRLDAALASLLTAEARAQMAKAARRNRSVALQSCDLLPSGNSASQFWRTTLRRKSGVKPPQSKGWRHIRAPILLRRLDSFSIPAITSCRCLGLGLCLELGAYPVSEACSESGLAHFGVAA